MTMHAWWVGWTFPDKHRADRRIAAKWPRGVTGWDSGGGGDDVDGYTTWCGRVEAETADDAQAAVLSMYGDLGGHVRWRWEPQPHPIDWWPGDRFPRPRGRR